MRQLKGVDAMHVLEETRAQHMHTIKIAILGRRPDGSSVGADEIRAWARQRLPLIPPMRWKVIKIPLGLGRPVFVEAGPYDVDRHVTVVTAAAPGGDEQLDAIVSRVASTRLSRDRPLWELTVVEGLSDGRVALVFKIHHAIMDGQASVRFFELALDGGDEIGFGAPPEAAQPTPTGRALVWFAMRSHGAHYRHLPAVIRRTATSVRDNRRHRATGAPAVVNPLSGPSTRFNRQPRMERIYVDVTVPWEQITALKTALGVTVNELFVAWCGGAIRRYLDEHDELPDRCLNCAHPVSLRTPEEIDDFGNRTSYWYVTLGTDIADPLQRIPVVKASLDAAREWAKGDVELFAVWQDYYLFFGKLTLKLLTLIEKLTRRPAFNAVVSNVRGPRPLSLAGAPVVAVRSMGPITRVLGLNMTAWSYGDTYSVGLQSCTDFMPDLRRMDHHLRAELAAMQQAALIAH